MFAWNTIRCRGPTGWCAPSPPPWPWWRCGPDARRDRRRPRGRSAVRLWDSETRWSQVEPRRRDYDWRTLDGLVTGAEKAGLPAMYVFGGTPGWAAPDGARSVYPEGARSAPPDDPSEWDGFVRALAGRYRGRIEAYDLWVPANDKRMWTGTPETLVAMTRRAARIIRAVDRRATVALYAPVTAVRHLDGRIDRPAPGDPVELTQEPILIQYR